MHSQEGVVVVVVLVTVMVVVVVLVVMLVVTVVVTVVIVVLVVIIAWSLPSSRGPSHLLYISLYSFHNSPLNSTYYYYPYSK